MQKHPTSYSLTTLLCALIAGLLGCSSTPHSPDAPVRGNGTITYLPSLDLEVVSAQRVDEITRQNDIDAPIATHIHNGIQYWYFPNIETTSPEPNWDFDVWTSITSGPINNIAANLLLEAVQGVFMPPINPGDQNQNGKKWLTNTYNATDGVLGFVHVEYADDSTPAENPPGAGRIGISWNDTEISPIFPFTYLGHVISSPEDPVPHNMHGTPYVIHETEGQEYFYIYYHEASDLNGGWGHIATARSPVENVLHNARQGLVTNWYKYNDGSWTVGLGGNSHPMEMWPIVVHGDAAKSTFNGRYYLAGYVTPNWNAAGGDNPGEIIIYESCDAVEWTESLRFAQYTDEQLRIRYLSITDLEGADNSYVGERMRLYSVHHDSGNDSVTVIRYTLEVDLTPCS